VIDAEVHKTSEKAARFEELLRAYYGPRIHDPAVYDSDLIGALIATILSQHTSDLNSGRAYASLKAAFPGGWEQVRTASIDSIADTIRSGGLAQMKAPRIKELLEEIRQRNGDVSIDKIRSLSDRDAMAYLTSFRGVGPKTAACVLMFNMGRPVIPVDTHVYRVSMRLGLIDKKNDPGQAQDILLDLIGEKLAYSFHVHLIEHGRAICHARNPKCKICPVAEECPSKQG
jgi:endonuclease-3